MYSYLPFCILFIINSRLILEFKNRKVQGAENDATKRRKRHLNRTVIFMTLLFISLTLPGAVIASSSSPVIKLPYGPTVVMIFVRVSSSYHAYGVIILYFTNNKFAQRLKACFSSKSLFNNSTTGQEKYQRPSLSRNIVATKTS